MASVPASHIILFVASLIVAAGIAGTVVLEVNQLSDAIETRGDTMAEEIETDITITSDEAHVESIYDDTDDELTILVKNVGSLNLNAHRSQVDLLVDGRYIASDLTTVERVDAESDSWRPGGVVEITIDIGERDDLTIEGDTRVSVIVNGNEDSIAFHVADD